MVIIINGKLDEIKMYKGLSSIGRVRMKNYGHDYNLDFWMHSYIVKSINASDHL